MAGFYEQVFAELTGDHGFFWTLGSYVAMVLAERLAYLFSGGVRWNERDASTNVINSSVTAIGDALLGSALFVGIYTLVHDRLRVFDVPWTWWGVVAAFLLRDLAYYVDHRIAHRTGFFWALHHTHHSSKEMNLTVASRGTILGLAGTLSPAYFVICAFMGVPFPMFVVVAFFGSLWGIFNHTRLVGGMGWLDDFFATPANHRVHHGVEAKYLDRNYGQTLIVWDRLFNTFQREEETPTFGLVKQLESDRLWDIQTSGLQWLVAEIQSAPRWVDKFRYLIMPPGWRHDGCHATSEAIRAGMPGCLARTG